MTYVRMFKAVPHAITDEETWVPWYELRYLPKGGGKEQVVAWHTTTSAEGSWQIVDTACNGGVACVVLNEDGFCWLEAWKLDSGGVWRSVVARKRNAEGRGAQGEPATRAEIHIKPDGETRVTIGNAKGEVHVYKLSLQRAAKDTDPDRKESSPNDFGGDWVKEPTVNEK